MYNYIYDYIYPTPKKEKMDWKYSKVNKWKLVLGHVYNIVIIKIFFVYLKYFYYNEDI